VAFAAALVAAVVALGAAFWSAQLTLSRSAQVARSLHEIRFSVRPLDLAASENPGFEPVSAIKSYTSGAALGADLYLAGPAGLSVIGANGTVRRVLRTGVELPVAPIVAVAVARLRGDSDAQVLLATAGAGLLLLNPKPLAVRQLLPESAAARELTALLALPSGDLLLGTKHSGVLVYTGSSLAPYGNLSAAGITALAAPDAASVLVGTRNAGLFYLHAGTVRHATGLPDEQIESLAVGNGKAYAGTPLGVAEFDLASVEGFKPSRILGGGLFAHRLSVTATDLLVGTVDQGIQRIPLIARPHFRNAGYDSRESPQRVDAFLSPSSALANGVLLGGPGWQPALASPSGSLADGNISALAFAPDGSLYVGFFDHGLDILSSNGGVRHFEDDHLFCVNRLALDPARQTMAAATANGLVLFDRQGAPRQTLTRRDGLIADHVNDLAFTGSGMTVATPAGLTFLGPSGAESLYAFQGLVNNHVYTLGASGNRLLAGTLGGISELESGSVKRNFTAANSGLKHNWITALAPAPQGGWLVGTYGAGLETLDSSGRFAPVELPAGAPRDLVVNPNALLVTPTHVYAGTLAHGMLVYSNATGRWAVVDKGLPSLNVTAFAARGGELYVGTENGLVRIAEAKL
jgi:hypothetical protein